MIRYIINTIKSWFTPKEEMDPHEVMLHPKKSDILILENENDVKLEETKMKRMLNDMMSRQDLEKGATISEDTVWGYGLFGTSGKTSPVAPEDPQSLHTD